MEQTTQAVPGLVEPRDRVEGALTAHRVKVFLAAAVLTAAFGYLAFQAFQSATAYYLTVGELVERGATEDGRTVRVNGKLVEGVVRTARGLDCGDILNHRRRADHRGAARRNHTRPVLQRALGVDSRGDLRR